MPFLFSYLLKFSLSLMLVYLFYQLVLRRLTFYQWNRFYLLGYSLLCFVIPFIHIDGWLQQPGGRENSIITIIPALGQYPAAVPPLLTAAPVAVRTWGLYDWLGVGLLAGTVLMAGRLALLFLSLHRLRRKSVLITTHTAMKLFETDAAISPFSFGRSVYLNSSRHTEEELQQIMRHEYVHVKQRHTIDLIAGELLCLVNWYNPFAWLMRYSIRQNLEFIADSKVLEKGVDKKEYQYLLLKVMGIAQYRIANNFNLSNLKKRIIMMNKMKSARLHLGRFLFVLPLLGVLLVAFRSGHHPGASAGGDYFTAAGIVMDLYTRKPLAGAQVIETRLGLAAKTDARGYYILRVPVGLSIPGAKPTYQFEASMAGYDTSNTGFSPAPGTALPENLVQIMGLVPQHATSPVKGAFMQAHLQALDKNEEHAAEISYKDALKGYHDYLGELDDMKVLGNLLANNPQVQKFYNTEDKLKHIVFLRNGGIEKYGYPGEQPVAELEHKYGPLPQMFKNQGTPPSYYNKQWEAISERLQKAFIPSGDAKAIVFPGDSRVLVQSANNQVEMYDMDYQQDRDKFEALYGKLPGLPPAGRSDTAPKNVVGKAIAFPPFNPQNDTVVLAVGGPQFEKIRQVNTRLADTAPFTIRIRKAGGRDTTITGLPVKGVGNGEPLFLLDGEEIPDLSNIIPANIERIDILKDATAIKRYGEKAINGVVLITTKKKKADIDTLLVKTDTISWSAAKHVFSMSGDSKMTGLDVTVQAMNIDCQGFPVQLAVNGKLLDMNRDYKLVNKGGRYMLNALMKEEAREKYGIETRDGVLEIRTL